MVLFSTILWFMVVKSSLANSDNLGGELYKIRTCDSLIKSHVDIFQDIGLFPKLESA
jgi:hypothetical protein